MENHKRKKKRRHEHERSFVGNASEHETSYNHQIDDTTKFNDRLHPEHTNLEESAKKKKKRRHTEGSLVGNVSEHEISYNHCVDGISVFDDRLHSEPSNIEKSLKKKKKHRYTEGSLAGNVSELYNITADASAVFNDRLLSEHTNIEESAKKKKKKHRYSEEKSLVGNLSEQDMSYNNIAVDATVVFDDLFHPEDTNLDKSVRKKKKHRHKDEGILVENVCREHEVSYNNLSIDTTGVLSDLNHENTSLETSARKKKRRHKGDITLIENMSEREISHNENVCGNLLEDSARKKKKKQRHEEERTLVENVPEYERSYDSSGMPQGLEASVNKKKKKKKKHHKDEQTMVVSENTISNNSMAVDNAVVFDNSLISSTRKRKKRCDEEETTLVVHNSLEEPMRRKKKKKPHQENVRTLVVKEDNISYRENVTSGPLHNVEDLLPSEHTNLTESLRKKNKKHKKDILNESNISAEMNILESTPKSHKKDEKKRKTGLQTSEAPEHDPDVSLPMNENSTPEESSVNKNEQDSVRKKKKKKHRQREESLVEEVLPPIQANSPANTFEKNTGTLFETENSNSIRDDVHINVTKEIECQTDSSMSIIGSKLVIKRSKSMEELEESIAETPPRTSTHVESGRPKRTAALRTELELSINNETESSEVDKTNSDKELGGPVRRGTPSTLKVLSELRERDIKLLEEYFPQIWSTSAGTVKNIISSDLGRIKKAKFKGILYNSGRFSPEEDELIKKNVLDFVTSVGLETPEMLFHPYRFPDMNATIHKLKREFNFMHRIADGLYRDVGKVYNRGLKLFDLSGRKGRFTAEEVKLLLEKCQEREKDWHEVANAVGRSRLLTQLKASQLRREVNKGHWSIDEVNRLIKAVKDEVLDSLKEKQKPEEELVMVSKEMLFNGISWVHVEEVVETRNWTHCKSKWNDLMLMRMNGGISPLTGLLGLYNNVKMIEWLHSANLERDIVDWKELTNFIGNVPPGLLQERMYKLKRNHVPHWQDLTLKEIVDYLYNEILPTLEDKLDGSDISEIPAVAPKTKAEFPIIEIFREYTGSERKRAEIQDKRRRRKRKV